MEGRGGRIEGELDICCSSFAPDHYAIVDGETVVGQSCDVPLPDLHLVPQNGAEGELAGTRHTTGAAELHPVIHLILDRLSKRVYSHSTGYNEQSLKLMSEIYTVT